MRVVIAEDLLLLREGLVRLLTELDWTVVSAVSDPDALLEAIAARQPDVAIVDIRLPPTYRDEGLRAAIEARRRRPGTPILILSQYIERTYVRELLADSRGGVGYLLKERVSDVRQFMADLSAVAAGGTVLDPQVVRVVFDRLSRTAPEAELTPREREVLRLMARGLSNSAIGEELDITERAVSKYINRIFAKRDLPPGDNVHRRVLAVLQYWTTFRPDGSLARPRYPSVRGVSRRTGGHTWVGYFGRGPAGASIS